MDDDEGGSVWGVPLGDISEMQRAAGGQVVSGAAGGGQVVSGAAEGGQVSSGAAEGDGAARPV